MLPTLINSNALDTSSLPSCGATNEYFAANSGSTTPEITWGWNDVVIGVALGAALVSTAVEPEP